jgi:Histidine kinase
MDATLSYRPAARQALAACAADFTRWLRTHRGAFTLAGLLAFATPVTLFTGAVSVMREPTAADVTLLALWWLLYGAAQWGLLLLAGYAGLRLQATPGRAGQTAAWLLCTAAGVAGVSLATTGRSDILVEQAVVYSVTAMHLNAFTLSFTMALLYFVHLRRSRGHEQAAARLAAAQAAQRDARRRTVQARLQALQARVDPQLLFEMLDAVRHAYQGDTARAEALLDELTAFLRAALPRLRSASSSVVREAELARAYARLQALAGATEASLALDIAPSAMHARLSPGVLLPLLQGALRALAGPCTLSAMRRAEVCQLVLTLPAAPAPAELAQVRALLADVYGAAAELGVDTSGGPVRITLSVPYELA